MISIPLDQYNDILSRIESEDHLSKKFQSFIENVGELVVQKNSRSIHIDEIKKILKELDIEMFVTNNIGSVDSKRIQVRIIKKEENASN